MLIRRSIYYFYYFILYALFISSYLLCEYLKTNHLFDFQEPSQFEPSRQDKINEFMKQNKASINEIYDPGRYKSSTVVDAFDMDDDDPLSRHVSTIPVV